MGLDHTEFLLTSGLANAMFVPLLFPMNYSVEDPLKTKSMAGFCALDNGKGQLMWTSPARTVTLCFLGGIS